jgi:hypothetical protein
MASRLAQFWLELTSSGPEPTEQAQMCNNAESRRIMTRPAVVMRQQTFGKHHFPAILGGRWKKHGFLVLEHQEQIKCK